MTDSSQSQIQCPLNSSLLSNVMLLSTLLQCFVLLTLHCPSLCKPTTQSITGTFTSPHSTTETHTDQKKKEVEVEVTEVMFTTTTPDKVETTKNEETTSSSWVTGTTSENGVVTASQEFKQQVNRPYCIINGQFYYAGPQKIYFGCFFVCECLGYGEFSCAPLCKPENKPCPSNRWRKERKGCCDEYVCLG